MSKYRIILEVEGTPVSTDEILRKIKDVPFVKSILRPLRPGEEWQDVVYKHRLDFWEPLEVK
jgi:hypothetical protein